MQQHLIAAPAVRRLPAPLATTNVESDNCTKRLPFDLLAAGAIISPSTGLSAFQTTGQKISIINSNGVPTERVCSIGDNVDCYRNLNLEGFFSIRQRQGAERGKITGYAQAVIIKSPVAVVVESSRQRVLVQKRKNVHAFIRGEVIGFGKELTDLTKQKACDIITYRPYLSGCFTSRLTGEPITNISGMIAVLSGSNVYLFETMSDLN